MILPFEVQKEINDFFEDIRELGYNCEFTEFSFARGKRNYDNIIGKLSKIDLPDPKLIKYSTMSFEELINILSEILIKIFGQDYKGRVNHYSSLVSLEKIDNPFDAVTETNLVNGEQVPTKIYISDSCKSIQIVSTGHEYVHCLLSKYDIKGFNEKINSVHYKELLSIVIEYIICYELSKMLKDEKLNEKHNLIRINHDKEQALERVECISLIPQLSKLGRIDAITLRSYIDYQEHNSFSYILSDIYSLYLLDVYKDSPNKLMELIKDIIDGDKCINDLIKYFNLSLRNQDVLGKYDSVMVDVSKTLHL